MAIRHEEPLNPNDPNRGINTRTYLLIIASAALVALIVGLVFVFAVSRKHSSAPDANPSAHPSSHLVSPPPLRSKPSPLHPAARSSEKAAPQL